MGIFYHPNPEFNGDDFSYQIGTEEDKSHFYGGTYRALLSLLRHEHEDTPLGLFWMVLCSVLHLRTLQMAGYFGPNVKYDQPLTEEQCLVGAFLVDILQLLRYNTHSVLEYVVSRNKMVLFWKNWKLINEITQHLKNISKYLFFKRYQISLMMS